MELSEEIKAELKGAIDRGLVTSIGMDPVVNGEAIHLTMRFLFDPDNMGHISEAFD
jgi:hypothetical protein